MLHTSVSREDPAILLLSSRCQYLFLQLSDVGLGVWVKRTHHYTSNRCQISESCSSNSCFSSFYKQETQYRMIKVIICSSICVDCFLRQVFFPRIRKLTRSCMQTFIVYVTLYVSHDITKVRQLTLFKGSWTSHFACPRAAHYRQPVGVARASRWSGLECVLA